MSRYPKIEITKEELIRTIYFILMKYGSDSLHLQGTSSKRDLVGGFIERWLNKLAETAVFDALFKDKPYEAVPDYFLYNNESEKNAPDIIGIRDKTKTIPFVQYNDGRWETIGNHPRIEVKALRKGQYLMGIRQPQMIDDFYVIENGKVFIPENALNGMDISFFVNHSKNPNLEIYYKGPQKVVAFKTLRKINKGEELIVSYATYDDKYKKR